MVLYCGNMPRRRHPKKEVERVPREAEALGWIVTISPRGHNWGRMVCPERSRSGCQHPIYSTPRNPGRHARDISGHPAKVQAHHIVRS